MTDFNAVATALAARFAPANLTAPTGYRTIRLATADLPNTLPPTPCVLVFPGEGDWQTGNGTRTGSHQWIVRFYYDQTSDLPRNTRGVLAWLTVLADQLKASVTLGGTVVTARLDSWQSGSLTYAGTECDGLELRVTTVTSESWSATA